MQNKKIYNLANHAIYAFANSKAAVEVAWNMNDADFYIKGKGSIDSIGEPTQNITEIGQSYIGVKVKATDKIVPQYLYYLFLYFYQSGKFKQYAKGTLRLQHITISDVREILSDIANL